MEFDNGRFGDLQLRDGRYRTAFRRLRHSDDVSRAFVEIRRDGEYTIDLGMVSTHELEARLDEQPVHGVMVTLSGPVTRRVRTDENGTALVEEIPPGVYPALATIDRITFRSRVVIGTDSQIQLDFHSTVPIRVRVEGEPWLGAELFVCGAELRKIGRRISTEWTSVSVPGDLEYLAFVRGDLICLGPIRETTVLSSAVCVFLSLDPERSWSLRTWTFNSPLPNESVTAHGGVYLLDGTYTFVDGAGNSTTAIASNGEVTILQHQL